MTVDVFVYIPKPNVKEGSSFAATAYFRTAGTATAPTTARYRIYNKTTGDDVLTWTDLTPAASISIPITATNTAIDGEWRRTEQHDLIVESDTGLSTQTRDEARYTVENIRGIK